MNMSNKNMALLLVAALVISLGGTFLSLDKINEIIIMAPPAVTGGALTGSGRVNLTISTNASCTVDSSVEFGSGSPTGAITISTETANTANFTDCNAGTACLGIYVNNTGNSLLNVSFNSTENGTTFLGAGAANADFKYLIDVSEPDSTDACTGTEGASSWTETPIAKTRVCDKLNFSDTRDAVSLEFNISLDENTPTGLKETTINVYCEETT